MYRIQNNWFVLYKVEGRLCPSTKVNVVIYVNTLTISLYINWIMGAKTSKNIVSDTMTEDDSQSYNLINIHTPTANIGITVFFCLVGVVFLVRLYMYVVRARCARPKTGAGGRRLPIRHDTAAVDMDSHIGTLCLPRGWQCLEGTQGTVTGHPEGTPV